MLKYFKKNKGFTLIELLVVIAIIAVLASIVLVSLNTARTKGRDARRIADIKSLQVALEMYYDGVGAGTYPTALSFLKDNGYIPAIPNDPKDNIAYKYAYTNTATQGIGKNYHLGAIMEDAGHNALLTDVDLTIAAAVAVDWTLEFEGASVDCGATAGTDKCYDVRN